MQSSMCFMCLCLYAPPLSLSTSTISPIISQLGAAPKFDMTKKIAKDAHGKQVCSLSL